MNRPRPKGRWQSRPSKDRIVASLVVVGQATAPALGRRLGMSAKLARQHLYELEKSGEVARTTGSDLVTIWRLAGTQVPEQEVVQTAPIPRIPRKQQPMVKEVSDSVHIVTSNWVVDHPIPLRSIFEAGQVEVAA